MQTRVFAKPCLRLLPMLLSIVSFISSASAQSYLSAIGSPNFATNLPMDGGSLDLSNGNLHLDIPISNPSQRGTLSALQELAYDSRIWQIVGTQWMPTNVPLSQAGWHFVTPTSGAVNVTTLNTPCDSPPPIRSQWLNRSFSWTDPLGVVRQFGVKTSRQYTTNDPCYDSGTPDISTIDGLALDGSRYHLYVTGYTVAVIYDSTGQQVFPKVEDQNGNYFTEDTNGNLIDTLGNTPVTKTTSGSTTTYTVLGFQAAAKPYTVTTISIPISTHFGVAGVSENTQPQTAIQSIALPDSEGSYSFTYDSYGELASETLPSGGVITFGYTNYTDAFGSVNRWLTSRVRDGGTWSYTPAVISSCGYACLQQVTVTTPGSSPDDTVYKFVLNNGAWNSAVSRWKGSSASGGGGTLMQSTSTSYDFSNPCDPSICTGAQYIRAMNGSTTLDNSYTTTQSYTYDTAATGNVTAAKLWDFYSGAQPTNPTVETDLSYAYTPTHAQPSVTKKQEVSYPSSSSVIDSTEVYNYDESSLASTPASINHETLSVPARGNLTSVTDWLDTLGNTTLATKYTFDDAGMTKTSLNPNPSSPKTSTYVYNSNGSVATSVTLPTPSSGVALAAGTTVDSSTGALLTSTDANGNTTNYVSYDWQLRPTEIDYPDGGKYTLLSTPTITRVNRYLSASSYSDTQTMLDAYGRVSRTAIANGQGTNPWYQTDSCYDLRGRLIFKSYAYQGTGWGTTKVCSGTDGTHTSAGDLYAYDALDRVTLVTHEDGTTVSTSYKGRAAMVTDENGMKRITQIDGLGRTSLVCEISSNTLNGVAPVSCGSGVDITGTGFVTSYSYDLANHKTTVTQGAQTRVFQRDPVGRTTFTQEPESGNTSYSFSYSSTAGLDLIVTRNRAMANQTDPNTFETTTTQYDSLSRVTQVKHTDGSPTRNFTYDKGVGWSNFPQTNLKGKLSLAGAETVYSYDKMGRVVGLGECLPEECGTSTYDKHLLYTYDLAGNLLSSSDGAGVTTTFTVSPAGEAKSMTSSLSDATHPANLLTSIQSNQNGPTNYTFGNGLTGVNSYDTLGRLNGGWVCSGSQTATCSGGTQYYGFADVWKGARVTSSSDTILNQGSQYGYDEFNRLTSRTVTTGTAQNFTYIYDRYGNRMQQNMLQTGPPSQQLYFDPATNRITTSGYTYDAAGNLTNDGFYSYTYDADGNVTAVNGGSTAAYVYNALNQRSRAIVAGKHTTFAFDQWGHRVSVWNAQTHAQVTGQHYLGDRRVAFYDTAATHFEHQDWEGTERLRTTYNAAYEGTFTSLPFGDWQKTGSGADGDAYHFALLDSDSETSTDHAQLRQYSSTHGSWMSPDPYAGSYHFGDPQSLNRYAYVLNNPISNIDPDGEDASQGLCYLTASNCGAGGGGGGVGGGGVGLAQLQMYYNTCSCVTVVQYRGITYIGPAALYSLLVNDPGAHMSTGSDGTVYGSGGATVTLGVILGGGGFNAAYYGSSGGSTIAAPNNPKPKSPARLSCEANAGQKAGQGESDARNKLRSTIARDVVLGTVVGAGLGCAGGAGLLGTVGALFAGPVGGVGGAGTGCLAGGVAGGLISAPPALLGGIIDGGQGFLEDHSAVKAQYAQDIQACQVIP